MKQTVNVLGKLNWGKRPYAVVVLWATTAIALPAQTFTSLYSFCSQSGCSDGVSPVASLVQATNGDLYGTTIWGGTGGVAGDGTVFKITPHGELTTLYSFCSQANCADGAWPEAALVQATNGDFYGTTAGLGAYPGTPGVTNCQASGGCGTVFKITPSGALTTLYRFCSQSGCTDGESPAAGLVQASNGDFYGTTRGGGAKGGGTVFRISPSGTLTTLYSFCSQLNCADGAYPEAALIQAANGDLYGTTSSGGACEPACGTVFAITPSGTLTTIFDFCAFANAVGCLDGSYPTGKLVQASNGNLYGTTQKGGSLANSCYAQGGCGTVFEISPSGRLTSLYSFCSQGSECPDGSYPYAGLARFSHR